MPQVQLSRLAPPLFRGRWLSVGSPANKIHTDIVLRCGGQLDSDRTEPMERGVTIEASGVVKLLRELGRSDPTCHAMAEWADHASTPVLEVCHEALCRLAAEKARLARVVEEMLVAVPAGSVFRNADDQAPYGSGD